MTQNAPLRLAAILLCTAVLTGTLAACRGNADTQTTASSTTMTTTTSTGATLPELGTSTGTDSGTSTGTDSGTGSGTGTDASGSAGSGSSGGVLGSMFEGEGAAALANARFFFNGAVYKVSHEEQLRRDELGRQLMLVQNTVDEPKADGDASVLPKGTRVYAIKDNTDYTSLAVEVDGMLYRANQLAQ